MAFGYAAPDMSGWLNRKYAILQQQANAADTQNATQRIGVVAAANVDNTRARLMPKESAANVAKTRAETGLVGEQTNWFGKSAAAEINNLNANARLTGFQGDFLYRQELEEAPGISASSIARQQARRPSMLSASGYGAVTPVAGPARAMPSMTSALPPRRLGESEASYMDRINGF